MNPLALLAALLLAGPAAAQTTVPPVAPGASVPSRIDGAAMGSLAALASGGKTGDDTFDGMPVLRREGPLAILSEEKDVLLSQYERAGRSTYYGGYGWGYPYGWGWGGGWGGTWTYEPPATVKVYGTRQKVGIADRGAYVRRQAKKGAGRGLLVGLLVGLVGLAAFGAVGFALGAGLSAAVGAVAADAAARRKPRVFEREFATRSEVHPH